MSRQYPRPRQSIFRSEPPLIAVHDVSFELATGQTMGIVGESGSGKSTIARMVMGFEKPNAGTVFFDGHDINEMPKSELQKLKPHFQMIFQDPVSSLDPRR